MNIDGRTRSLEGPLAGRLHRAMLGFIVAIAGIGLSACSLSPDNMIRASRQFSGPSDFPPDGYAGYGIVAFPQLPEVDRGRLFCSAYIRTLIHSDALEQLGVPLNEQMVTVWPVDSSEAAIDVLEIEQRAGGYGAVCDTAVEHYDLASGLKAIHDAKRADPRGEGAGTLGGRGPFLLAWSPGGEMGTEDTLVLVSDLSAVSSHEQAVREFRRWRDEIQLDTELWSDGWSLQRLRILVQRWSDRRSGALLSVIGVEI